MSDQQPPAAPADQPPEPQNKGQTGPARDAQGRLLPGHTANPGGRPASSKQFRELARTFSTFALKRLVEIAKANNGPAGVRACELILERCWGRVPMEVSGPGGKPIDMRFGGAAKTALEQAIADAAAQAEAEKAPSEN